MKRSVHKQAKTELGQYPATIPDKRAKTRSKLSSRAPTFNVDNQVIFSLFVGNNPIFSNEERMQNNVDRASVTCEDAAYGSRLPHSPLVCHTRIHACKRETKETLLVVYLGFTFSFKDLTYGYQVILKLRTSCSKANNYLSSVSKKNNKTSYHLSPA